MSAPSTTAPTRPAPSRFEVIHQRTIRRAINESFAAAEQYVATLSAADQQSVIAHVNNGLGGRVVSRCEHRVNVSGRGAPDFRHLTGPRSLWQLDEVVLAALLGAASLKQHVLRPLALVPKLDPAPSKLEFWQRAIQRYAEQEHRVWSPRLAKDLLQEFTPAVVPDSGGEEDGEVDTGEAHEEEESLPIRRRTLSRKSQTVLESEGEEDGDTTALSEGEQQGEVSDSASLVDEHSNQRPLRHTGAGSAEPQPSIDISSGSESHDTDESVSSEIRAGSETQIHASPDLPATEVEDEDEHPLPGLTASPQSEEISSPTCGNIDLDVASPAQVDQESENMASRGPENTMRFAPPNKKRKLDQDVAPLSQQHCVWDKSGALPESHLQIILKFLSISCQDFAVLNVGEQLVPTNPQNAARIIFFPPTGQDQPREANYAWADPQMKNIRIFVANSDPEECRRLAQQFKAALDPTHPDNASWTIDPYDAKVPVGHDAFFAMVASIVFDVILRRPCQESEVWLFRRWLSAIITSHSRPPLVEDALLAEARCIDLKPFTTVMEARNQLELMARAARYLLRECRDFLTHFRLAFRKVLVYEIPALPSAAQSSALQDLQSQQTIAKLRGDVAEKKKWFGERQRSLLDLTLGDEDNLHTWLDTHRNMRADFLEQLGDDVQGEDKILWESTAF